MFKVPEGTIAFRIPFWLKDSDGNPVNGIAPADIWDNDSTGNVTVFKADGSWIPIELKHGTTWVEIGIGTAPGLYHFVLDARCSDVKGPIQISLQPKTGKFVGTILNAEVCKV